MVVSGVVVDMVVCECLSDLVKDYKANIMPMSYANRHCMHKCVLLLINNNIDCKIKLKYLYSYQMLSHFIINLQHVNSINL